MTNKTKIPQAELFQGLMDSFSTVASKVSDLQQYQMEQMRKIIEVSVNSTKTLSEVKSQDDFNKVWGQLLKENGVIFTQVFLDNLKNSISVWCDSCDSSAVNSGKLKDFSMKFLDFYSQLVPSKELFQLNSLARNAASGNIDAISSLKELVKTSMQQFGDQVKNSAEQMNSILTNLANQTNK